ncbi:hypothetical protein D9M72_488690 [compost metagenome]
MTQRARKAAGTKPARNSVVVEMVVMDPRISSTMLGGMVSPMMAEADRTATTSPRGYLRSSSMPRMVVPTAATSATLEPEMPEKMYMVTTTTWSRPPRRCPIRASTSLASGRVRPAEFITVPARIKNGIARRTKPLAPEAIPMGMALTSEMPPR